MQALGPFSSYEKYIHAVLRLMLNLIMQEAIYTTRAVDAFVHRFLLDCIPHILSCHKFRDGQLYLRHADDKGDRPPSCWWRLQHHKNPWLGVGAYRPKVQGLYFSTDVASRQGFLWWGKRHGWWWIDICTDFGRKRPSGPSWNSEEWMYSSPVWVLWGVWFWWLKRLPGSFPRIS